MVNFYLGFAFGFIVAVALAIIYYYKRGTGKHQDDKPAEGRVYSNAEQHATTGCQTVEAAAEATAVLENILNSIEQRSGDVNSSKHSEE